MALFLVVPWQSTGSRGRRQPCTEQRMCAGLLSDAEPSIHGAAPIASGPRLHRCFRRWSGQTRCGHGVLVHQYHILWSHEQFRALAVPNRTKRVRSVPSFATPVPTQRCMTARRSPGRSASRTWPDGGCSGSRPPLPRRGPDPALDRDSMIRDEIKPAASGRTRGNRSSFVSVGNLTRQARDWRIEIRRGRCPGAVHAQPQGGGASTGSRHESPGGSAGPRPTGRTVTRDRRMRSRQALAGRRRTSERQSHRPWHRPSISPPLPARLPV